jgi:hypothetical protein
MDAANAMQGVEWIDEHRLMFASDRAKANQPFICTTRDQGVHVSIRPSTVSERPSHDTLVQPVAVAVPPWRFL